MAKQKNNNGKVITSHKMGRDEQIAVTVARKKKRAEDQRDRESANLSLLASGSGSAYTETLGGKHKRPSKRVRFMQRSTVSDALAGDIAATLTALNEVN